MRLIPPLLGFGGDGRASTTSRILLLQNQFSMYFHDLRNVFSTVEWSWRDLRSPCPPKTKFLVWSLAYWNKTTENNHAVERREIRVLVPGLLFISCFISNMAASSLHSSAQRTWLEDLLFANSGILIKYQNALCVLLRFRNHKGRVLLEPSRKRNYYS